MKKKSLNISAMLLSLAVFAASPISAFAASGWVIYDDSGNITGEWEDSPENGYYYYADYVNDDYYLGFYDDVGGIIDEWWSGKTARWDYYGAADKFDVALYRDGKSVATVSTSKTSYNFSSKIKRSGYYYFKVRARLGSQKSSWGDESEDKYFSVNGGGGHNSSASGRNTYVTGSSNNNIVTIGCGNGEWKTASDGSGKWWYRHQNGSYTANNWEQIDGKWYFFDGSGWMVTGWMDWNGQKYYLQPDGSMAVGTVIVDGHPCYFDNNGALR